MMRRGRMMESVMVTAAVAFGAQVASAQAVVPLPTDVPVWLVGHDAIDGTRLGAYEEVHFSMGRTDKDGPLQAGVEGVARCDFGAIEPVERTGVTRRFSHSPAFGELTSGFETGITPVWKIYDSRGL